MKTFLENAFTRRSVALCWLPLFLLATEPLANAAPLQEARVSQVIQEVRLLEAHAEARPAVVNDKVTQGRAVRTGVESRAELTFADLTITRLGANTIFSFTGTRELNLKSGAILMEVPVKAAPLKASTTSVTVAITGGTALFAKGPPTKFMVLEGLGTFYPIGHPEKAVTVHAGEMVMMTKDGKITDPEEFDVRLVLETSLLITDFPPLVNLPLILEVVNQQLAEQQLFGTTTHTLAGNLLDVIDVTDQNANANPILVADRIGTPAPTATPSITPPPTPTPSITPPPTPTPSITPPPTPTKFGTPATITSPNPYLITSGTVITTDPSISTNGVTDSGKIYRGSTDDGAFTQWAFGSTSAFDNALDIDTEFFADANHLPIAVFKFENLSLTGNPTIDTSNGVTHLGLIGVDGITSGPPGGILTFTGLDLLLLATVNGSINLTSDISFQGINELAMYARGAGSDLILNSPISNIGTLELAAEGSIFLTNPGTMSVGDFETTAGNNLTLQIGGSLVLNGRLRLHTLVLPGTTLANGANLILSVTGDYTNNSATESSRLSVTNEGAHIGTGGIIAANIGGDLTTTGAGGDFELVIQNTNGQIDNGGNIALTLGGSIDVAGALSTTLDNTGGIIGSDVITILISSGAITVHGDATFQILNSDNDSGGPPGQIGGNAIIGVSSGGDFSANSLNGIINDRHAGSIGSSAELAFDVGGALSITNDATLGISTRNDGTGGGTIGSDATVGLSAGSISVGGAFTTFVSTNGGGSIAGDAINEVGTPGDLIVQGPILMSIEDTGFNQINPINFIAGGHIGGDATVTLAAQNITTSSTATGIPGTDTMALEASIYTNGQGTIGGNAIVNVIASQDISAPGTVFFTVANGNYQNFGPGTIGGDAQINVTASNLSTGALFDDIYNYGGASIGGDAIISLDLSNNLNATGDAQFGIFSRGGIITRNAAINVSAANVSTTGNFDAEIGNSTGGTIGQSAAISVATNGASISVGGDFSSGIFNQRAANVPGPDGGSIGTDATLSINGTSLSVGGGLSIGIFNMNNGSGSGSGGSIGGNAALNLNVSGDFSTQADMAFRLLNSNDVGGSGGFIGSNATITLHAANLVSGGELFVHLGNANDGFSGSGGMIAGSAGIMFSLSRNLTTQSDASLVLQNGYPSATGGGSGGSIADDAVISLGASAASIGGILNCVIDNARNAGQAGGSIGGSATVNLNITNTLSSTGAAELQILNGGATIGGSATIDLTTANITANSLLAQIDNTGGSIGANTNGGATINMNVSGTATVTNDATVAIYGSDGAVGDGAAININGGNYNVGGTFLSYIDGNGTITFNNATAHADVLKAGVFGANGALNIGGGVLSADSTLKLYAPGSNGSLNFVSNVTLGGNSLKILAANSVTIFNNVVVTIGGPNPADVYTNNPNYTGFGGNGTTTGTFAGAGANKPQPLSKAPPFGPNPARMVRAGGSIPSTRTTGGTPITTVKSLTGSGTPGTRTPGTTINVRNTDQLLSLLDHTVPDPGGKITIPNSKRISDSRNSSRLNADRQLRANREAMDGPHVRARSAGDARMGVGKRIL